MAELGHLEQLATKVQRYAGIAAAAVPEGVVIGKLAAVRHLIGARLDLLQAHDVRPVALEPVAELRLARADSVDVPRGDLHGTIPVYLSDSRNGGLSYIAYDMWTAS